MDRNELVAEFKRRLCKFHGYDEKLRFVGTAKSVPLATEGKVFLGPRDFLSFALEDSEGLESERNRINCLGNCKRAIDSQADRLISSLGFLPLARKQGWKTPRKFEFIRKSGVLAPRILEHVNQLRNRLEHGFAPPSKRQVEDALDVAALFISYAELVRIPTLNCFFHRGPGLRYDYDEMRFLFFESDISDLPDDERSPLFSLSYGEQGFQDFYDFLMKTAPLMERKGRLGEDI